MTLRNILVVVFLTAGSGLFAQSGDPYFAERTDPGVSIQLYPIPAQDYVNIRLGQLEAKGIHLSLHNVIGNEISTEMETISDSEIRLRVKDMASGYYFVTIKDEATRYRGTFKFLKR